MGAVGLTREGDFLLPKIRTLCLPYDSCRRSSQGLSSESSYALIGKQEMRPNVQIDNGKLRTDTLGILGIHVIVKGLEDPAKEKVLRQICLPLKLNLISC